MFGADLTCSLLTLTCSSARPTVIPPSRTKVRYRQIKPSLTVATWRLVVLNVDADVVQLADPFTVAIDHHLAVPFGDFHLESLWWSVIVEASLPSLVAGSHHIRTGLNAPRSAG